jgi:hypothetical protein
LKPGSQQPCEFFIARVSVLPPQLCALERDTTLVKREGRTQLRRVLFVCHVASFSTHLITREAGGQDC